MELSINAKLEFQYLKVSIYHLKQKHFKCPSKLDPILPSRVTRPTVSEGLWATCMQEDLVPIYQPSYRYLAIVSYSFSLFHCALRIHQKLCFLKFRISHGGPTVSCIPLHIVFITDLHSF